MFFNCLPEYEGPFKVGFFDVEAAQKSKDKPGALMRIYYPSKDVTHASGESNWVPDNWLYAKGYGNFLQFPFAAIALFLYPALSFTRKRAIPNLSLLETEKPLPLALFSHGLGGMRTTYSQICGNLASRGMIVCSIEHADGSAIFTSRLNRTIEIPYQHTDEETNTDEEILKFRIRQVSQRRDEVIEAIQVLKDINEAKFESLHALDENQKKIISQFHKKMNFEEMAVLGHSFGAATAIKLLGSASDIKFKCAVLLDPWMYSVQDCKVKGIPVLNLQSANFHWKDNLDAMKNLMKEDRWHPASLFGHIRDSSHQDASDLGLLFPSLMAMMKKSGPIDPKDYHLIQEKLIRDFMKKHISNISMESKTQKIPSIDSFCRFGQDSWSELRAK